MKWEWGEGVGLHRLLLNMGTCQDWKSYLGSRPLQSEAFRIRATAPQWFYTWSITRLDALLEQIYIAEAY